MAEVEPKPVAPVEVPAATITAPSTVPPAAETTEKIEEPASVPVAPTTAPVVEKIEEPSAAPVATSTVPPAETSDKAQHSTAATTSRSVASDKLPAQDVLDAVYELDVVDKEKKAVKFRTLVQQTPQRRNLIIFIRHFFCGFCQEYIRALARELPPSKLASLSIPTTLTIIGCGDAKMIPAYIKETNCPYDIYADSTRKIYNKLGFVVSFSGSKDKPEYITTSLWTTVFAGVKQGLKAGFEGRKAGKISQNGGEMVWIDGELRFLHRMRDTMSHLEMKDLQTVLA